MSSVNDDKVELLDNVNHLKQAMDNLGLSKTN